MFHVASCSFTLLGAALSRFAISAMNAWLHSDSDANSMRYWANLDDFPPLDASGTFDRKRSRFG